MLKEKYGIVDILKTIPHRFPFVYVDEVWGISESGGFGKKNITFNESCFQGHFPMNPIYPGVLQLEGLAQCGAVIGLTYLTEIGELKPSEVFEILFLGIDKCRFRHVVQPGDILVYEITFSKVTTKLAKFGAVAKVGDEVATEAEMMAMFRTKDA